LAARSHRRRSQVRRLRSYLWCRRPQAGTGRIPVRPGGGVTESHEAPLSVFPDGESAITAAVNWSVPRVRRRHHVARLWHTACSHDGRSV